MTVKRIAAVAIVALVAYAAAHALFTSTDRFRAAQATAAERAR